jgi:circadian clock protein KaiC
VSESKGNWFKGERQTTGVKGLDEILGGGLIEGGLYLIEGVPGAGKTIMSSQISFHMARQGKKVLFTTLIAESHGKLLGHLESLAFFDRSLIADRIVLLSGYQELLRDGLEGLLKFIATVIHDRRPEFLVIDGFSTAVDLCRSGAELARFIHELNTLITGYRCTTLLLAPLGGNARHPEHTLVDGLLELNVVTRGMRRTRLLEVHKQRGSAHLEGRHQFSITNEGVQITPRLEAAIAARGIEPAEIFGVEPMGVPSLDRMLSGGLPAASTTAVLGAPGAGKTTFGLHFLHAGLVSGAKALYFGFYEAPGRLLRNAAAVGMDLSPFVADGRLALMWNAPLEVSIDKLALALIARVKRDGIQRVVIDGIEGFLTNTLFEERFSLFATALTLELRALGATTLITEELDLFTAEIKSKAFQVSALIENVVVLRYVEIESELRRLISVLKLRGRSADPAIRELTIGAQGLVVGDKFRFAGKTLTGSPDIELSREPGLGRTEIE